MLVPSLILGVSPNRLKFILFVFSAFAAGYLVSGLFTSFYREEYVGRQLENTCGEAAGINVEIVGAVANPGVYEMEEGSRVIDLIKTAGDFTSDYDYNWVSKNLNLSQILEDEQKIFIPSEFLGYSESVKGASVNVFSTPGGSVAAQSSASFSSTSNSSGNEGKVNVNEATFDELDALPGIGEVYAGKIIANRPYTGAEEFKQKSGLSNSVYEKIKDLIVF